MEITQPVFPVLPAAFPGYSQHIELVKEVAGIEMVGFAQVQRLRFGRGGTEGVRQAGSDTAFRVSLQGDLRISAGTSRSLRR